MIKKISIIFLILFVLAIFTLIASNLPDRFEKVVENSGVEEQYTIWDGLMDNYLIETLNNPTNSKVISGTIGNFFSFNSGFIYRQNTPNKKV